LPEMLVGVGVLGRRGRRRKEKTFWTSWWGCYQTCK